MSGSALLNRSATELLKQSGTELKIGGLTRLSSCDWPGQLAATVFCQGCAWDCPYCHNPDLRAIEAKQLLPWASVRDFLQMRKGLLDAVVFSGGEPLLQPALSDVVAEVQSLGFRVGLHTTGMLPDRFAALLPLLDWVGFDIKAPFANYARVTGMAHSGDKAFESLRRLLAANISYEVRTTLHPVLLGMDEMLFLKEELLREGVTNFVVQHFRPQGCREDRLLAGYTAPILPANYGDGFRQFHVR